MFFPISGFAGEPVKTALVENKLLGVRIYMYMYMYMYWAADAYK